VIFCEGGQSLNEIRVTAIEGNRQRLDGGAMFGNAPRAVWEKWIQPDEQGRIPLNCRAMLLEIGGKNILCETGVGAFFEPKLADRFGVTETSHRLIENLNAIGIGESDIDFVILSHLHFDHAGGLMPSWAEQQNGRKDLLFPKAKYVVGTKAFERAQSPHPRDRASFIPQMTEKLLQSGRLILVDKNRSAEVFPDQISFRFTDGHTPGHMHTIAQGQSAAIIFAGDLIPGRAWAHLPITMGYDRFAEQVIDEKRSLYDDYSGDRHWFFYTHDHEIAMSHIQKDATGRYTPFETIKDPQSMVI
jgi:glyoxylase-like metal-dependent hydrolase (beta-lactamase superfamily II)